MTSSRQSLGEGEEIRPARQRYQPNAVRTLASENIVGEAHGVARPLGETSHVMFTLLETDHAHRLFAGCYRRALIRSQTKP
jgi:hypothetical protein